ncbi:hypothetical protein FN846DRAFT_960120 [Sphaerosporella brunnea]|uniref:Uncharacterized protein n=1 Tax=Sphaerosporella brunnea TaxID=1250544 RepID=A0A5J5EPI5_9PEZI|nr:hypothetical protein FN846DRAFT_960120 [Sphaerosporella brunnea]
MLSELHSALHNVRPKTRLPPAITSFLQSFWNASQFTEPHIPISKAVVDPPKALVLATAARLYLSISVFFSRAHETRKQTFSFRAGVLTPQSRARHASILRISTHLPPLSIKRQQLPQVLEPGDTSVDVVKQPACRPTVRMAYDSRSTILDQRLKRRRNRWWNPAEKATASEKQLCSEDPKAQPWGSGVAGSLGSWEAGRKDCNEIFMFFLLLDIERSSDLVLVWLSFDLRPADLRTPAARFMVQECL